MTTETTVPAPASDRQTNGHGQEEETKGQEYYVVPPADIYEDDEGLTIMADLPGVDSSSLEVRVERGILTIQGRAKHLARGQPIYQEFQLTGFFRHFRLPQEIDDERIDAELRNGVLILRLRRSERAKPRRIEVKAG